LSGEWIFVSQQKKKNSLKTENLLKILSATINFWLGGVVGQQRQTTAAAKERPRTFNQFLHSSY
jgi:hypothetical protein